MAVLLLLLLLITGTYAWTQFNNVGFNVVYTETNFGGRFHDNFLWYDETGAGTHNKDLFAENFGDNNIFVRARLREFLRIGGETQEPVGGASVDLNTPSTWPIYVSQPGDAAARRTGTPAATIGNRGISWQMGQTSQKVFMPTFNHATHIAAPLTNIHGDVTSQAPLYAHANAYRMIEATGMAVDALAGGLMGTIADPTEVAHVRDILAAGVQTGPGLLGNTMSAPVITNPATPPANPEGHHNRWQIGDTMTSPRLYTYHPDSTSTELRIGMDDDNGTAVPFVHTARATPMPAAVTNADPTINVTNGVITMQQWNQANRPTGDFWVLDVDGWFYWATPLAPAVAGTGGALEGGATSLLLDGITIPELDEEIEYVIQVDAEFTNRTNIEIAPNLADMTADAIALWLDSGDQLRRLDVSVTGITAATTDVGQGSTFTPGAMTITDPDDANVPVAVTSVEWSMTPDRAGVSVNATSGLVTVAQTVAEGTTFYLVARITTPLGMTTRRFPMVVVDDTPPLPAMNTRGELVNIGGTDFCVLVPASNERGGLGNVLIITHRTIGQSRYTDATDHVLFENISVVNNPENIRTRMNTWFNIEAPDAIRASALQVHLNGENGRSMPTGSPGAVPNVLPGVVASVIVPFPLSSLEAEGNSLALTVTSSLFTGATDTTSPCLGRQAQNLAGANDSWWLRSAAANPALARLVHTTGDPTNANVVNTFGVRPALWVRP